MTTTGSSDRAGVLAKIRQGVAKAVTASDAERRKAVEQRLAGQKPHLLPDRINRERSELVKLFLGFLQGQSATVIEVASKDDVPAAVGRYLRENNLPARLRHGEDAYLKDMPWSREPQLECREGRAQATDEVGMTHAVAGVAETGTLIFCSGPENPVTLNFMPDTTIAVLREADIVDAYETAWTRVRERYGRGAMPRTVNFISGPSRTADIGGKLVIGAHGPRGMCVVVVKGEGA